MVFRTRGEKSIRLSEHDKTPIIRHIKVRGEKSPYDGDWIYWGTRMGQHPETNKRVAILLKKQKGKCTECGLYFSEGDILEIDHKVPLSLKKGKTNTRIYNFFTDIAMTPKLLEMA
jgi:RNA-directed DNA polymerase